MTIVHKLNLDFVDHTSHGDGTGPIAPDGVLPAETVAEFQEYGLTYQIVERHGPGGGNPNVDLYGTAENLTRYVREAYLGSDEVRKSMDLQFILNGMQQVNTP
jgi:hypothetical protein